MVCSSITLAGLVALTIFVFVVLGPPAPLDLVGTAPQTTSGRTYPGSALESELVRLIFSDGGGEVRNVDCPDTVKAVPNAKVGCLGHVDGTEESLIVTFQDGEGHFTLHEE